MKLLKRTAILTGTLVILTQTPTQAQVTDPAPLQKWRSWFGTQSDAAPPPPPDIGKPKKLADAGGRVFTPPPNGQGNGGNIQVIQGGSL
ncbi:MAG: hypothetical protein HC866_25870, partial [Leptolyngbyaceae cyanobacterium RU_5_1]|nr:hypothetical protein [Leptolyngbyaceae cyanobacterium RU_5_1]